jgi:NADP-dependent 3-hydroxy acid dehydrogenase YdfG
MAIRTNDRVLVTGAAAGFGLALTRLLAERGCRVLASDLASDVPACLAGRAGVTYRQLDVRVDADWQAARNFVTAKWQGLDLLFNNAGIGCGGDIEEESIERWQEIIEINLLGVVRGCKTFVPLFKEQRSGHLVNTASAAGLVHRRHGQLLLGQGRVSSPSARR